MRFSPVHLFSNACTSRAFIAELALVLLFVTSTAAHAQTPAGTEPDEGSAGRRSLRFLAGAAAALGAHESGHLVADFVFDADPHLTKVEFHGIPFFAITPRAPLSPRRSFIVSSSGFWVQHATDEWLLTRRPGLRQERAPFAKGVLAFNVLASAAYAGAAFARTGPLERDTHGMATAARLDERWVGALILAPAALDTLRYFNPDARWAVWASRLTKAGMVVLVLR